MKAIFLIILLPLIICYQTTKSQNSTTAASAKSIDSIINKKISESGIVGVAAAIIINKKLVWKNAYGLSDLENKIPFTTSTLMNIASISKTFTGVCLMKAVEQGKVSLDEDINSYLPFKIINPYYPDNKVTLRNLSTHTSGLADRNPFYADSMYFYGKDSPEPLGEFLKNYFIPGSRHYSRDNFVNHKTGTYRGYSNIGAGLAGYILELRTGKKLNDYCKQYIFNPLEIKNAGWFLSEIDLKKHTKLYKKQDGAIQEVPLYGITTYPDGGVHISVEELSKFFICLLNDGKYNTTRILKKETAREMLRFQFSEMHKPENVELKNLNSGIFWATKMGATRIGHNGSDPGVRTFMLSDLKKEIAIILFANTSVRDEEEVLFLDIYKALYQYGVELTQKLK